MESAVPLIPVQASNHAADVDALTLFLTLVSGFFIVLIAGLIVYFAIRYRRRSPDELPPQYRPSYTIEVVWTVVPSILLAIMFVWSALLYLSISKPPADALEIFVVGKQWMWKIQHPDGQREQDTLHIPLGRPIKLVMTSEDVIHSFYIPAFRVKYDVIPGRLTSIWFQPTKLGRFHLFCAEYCGTWHSRMRGQVIVQEPAEFEEWLNSRSDGSMASVGRQLFLQLQCISCHTGTAQGVAPNLEEIYGRTIPLQNGQTVVADDEYIRESILNPRAKIVAGYQPIMPTFQGQISAEDLLKLTVYLKSLGKGQTPPRVEETPPPIGEQVFNRDIEPNRGQAARPKDREKNAPKNQQNGARQDKSESKPKREQTKNRNNEQKGS